jgi:hypothetical protein
MSFYFTFNSGNYMFLFNLSLFFTLKNNFLLFFTLNQQNTKLALILYY